MITIAQAVDEIISRSPFLEEALGDGLINVTSLARRLQPEVEHRLHKSVKQGAIVMAISRRPSNMSLKVTRVIKDFMYGLGDTIVRSDLSEYTFANSATLTRCNGLLMEEASQMKEVFCTISQGVFETTLVVSNALNALAHDIYAGEKLLARKERLSSVTLRLPVTNTEVSGVYYFLLKNLAWAGINVCEIISTSNEVTFVVDEKDINRAFGILMSLKQEHGEGG